MSELKSVYIDRTGDWCRSGKNTGNFYLREEADKVIAELEDKLRHYPMMTALIESGNKEIAELKAENQKLKRALWLARAERAKEMCQRLLIQGFDPKWEEVERKCRAKAKEYK